MDQKIPRSETRQRKYAMMISLWVLYFNGSSSSGCACAWVACGKCVGFARNVVQTFRIFFCFCFCMFFSLLRVLMLLLVNILSHFSRFIHENVKIKDLRGLEDRSFGKAIVFIILRALNFSYCSYSSISHCRNFHKGT